MNRRELLTSAGAFALLAAEQDPLAFGQALSQSPTNNTVDVVEYWSRFYDDAVGFQSKGDKGLAKSKRETLYLHSADSQKSLSYAENLRRDQLPQIKGDAIAKVALSQYRPGNGDIGDGVTHLRIDATQSFDNMNVIAPLSWAAIASVTPDKMMTKLPSIDQLGFPQSAKSASLSQIVLPSGVGKFAVNVTKPANETFTKILQSASVGITSVLSMMTLPAVSVPAIKVFSELFGKWQQHATILMNGNLKPVIATSTPPEDLDLPGDPMPLLNGYYVMFPEEHKDELTAQFQNLTLQNGFLVHKDAPASQDPATRVHNAVPGVTYASLRVSVFPAVSTGCTSRPSSQAASDAVRT